MRVELINKEEIADLYKNHGMFACGCYNTPDKYAEKIGKSCQESGHVSGSRCEYFKFRIYDVDRGSAEQIMRHEVGVKIPIEDQDNYYFGDVIDINPSNIVKNMASFRYIDKDGFTYTTPKNIAANPDANRLYDNLMDTINDTRRRMKEILEDDGVPPKKATEDVNFVLPRATNSMLTIGLSPEALINFMHKRLCTRAQDEIRAVAIAMRNAVHEVLPEWTDKNLVPHCKYLMWCPEGKMSCGAAPTKEQLKEKFNER